MGFKEIVFGAIGYVYLYKVVLAKALLIPFSLYMALDAIEITGPSPFFSIGLAIANLMVQTIFAITTHRVILLGPKSVSKWGMLNWTKREMFFALHIIGLGLIMIPLVVLNMIPGIGWILIIGSMFWITGRVSLVFPAIAIDRGVSFKYSWQLTKNHQILMLLVILVFPMLMFAPTFLFSMTLYSSAITSFLSALATVFTVAALSVTYKTVYKEAYES